MRVGTNPNKGERFWENKFDHRVFVPVYLPNLNEDYFKDGLKIFKLSLESLLATKSEYTAITIIANSCCKEVLDYIYSISENIDQVIINNLNRGKIDSLKFAVKGVFEPFVTFADADVLFQNNWESEVFKIFSSFPKAQMVCPGANLSRVPVYSELTFFDNIFKIKKERVVDINGIKHFYNSIQRPKSTEEINNQLIFTLTREKEKAFVGGGHFVATYKSQAYSNLDNKPHRYLVSHGEKFLDEVIYNNGGWRLSLMESKVMHLGNLFKDEMLLLNPNPVSDEREFLDESVAVVFKTRFLKLKYFLGKIFLKFYV
jgi:hypothetical protein